MLLYVMLVFFTGDETLLMLHNLNISACEVTFMCSSAIDGECIIEVFRNNKREHVRRGAINSSITISDLLPNSFYSYRLTCNTQHNMTLIIANKNFTTDNGKNR